MRFDRWGWEVRGCVPGNSAGRAGLEGRTQCGAVGSGGLVRGREEAPCWSRGGSGRDGVGRTWWRSRHDM